MNGVHDGQDLHLDGHGYGLSIPGESHGAGNVGNELRDPEIETGLGPGFAEIAEKDQIGDLRVLEEVIGHTVDRDVHPFGQGPAMDFLLHFDQFPAQVFIDVEHHGLEEVPFLPPMVIEGGDVDAHPLGDQTGGGSVVPVFPEDPAGHDQDPGLHGFGVFTGLFERGARGFSPVYVSII